jgi:hypothetical protein
MCRYISTYVAASVRRLSTMADAVVPGLFTVKSVEPLSVVSVSKSIGSPQFRSQCGQRGAYISSARSHGRTADTLSAFRVLVDRFENEVDPEGRLAIQARAKRAVYARNARMQRMALKDAQVRCGQSRDPALHQHYRSRRIPRHQHQVRARKEGVKNALNKPVV